MKVPFMSLNGTLDYLSKLRKDSGFHWSGMPDIPVRTRLLPMHRQDITLFEDFFLQGNFRLPVTEIMAHILQYYGFHKSQMSPPGMVRVRHFEFLCRSHEIEHTKRGYPYCDDLPWPDVIEKEELPIPKGEAWYLKLTTTPNRIFGENFLVVMQMSDQWPAESNEVPVLKFKDREAHLYQAAFPTFSGSMGVCPLRPGEQYWYDHIKGHFLYPPTGSFANPPTATEGAHLPNPRPLRAMTSAGKEILYLSSEKSVGSSNGKLSSWSNIFVGVSRNLGIDPEEKKKKKKKKLAKKKKKVITIDPEPTSKKGGSSRATAGAFEKGTLRFRQSNLEDYVITSDSLEGFYRIGGKKSSALVQGVRVARVPGTQMLVLLPPPSRLMTKMGKKRKKSLLRS
ncbi:hypothetical protein Hdeb2414_s0015g00445461 [Helianthus debilis subsp. tardiflorus]